jgi:protein SCO1
MNAPGSTARLAAVAIFYLALYPIAACNRSSLQASSSDCLPAINLIDQNGQRVSLSSLKGKPVLVDFIYTSCPGPCKTLTQRMIDVAQKLGPTLGSQVTMVSISIDPEHDGPQQMLDYARTQGAARNGWLFLTGGPGEVDATLAAFGLSRERESDGSVSHIVGVILVGADGRKLHEYNGENLKYDTVAADLRIAIGRG